MRSTVRTRKTRTSASGSQGIHDLPRKLRSVGIVNWDGKDLRPTLRRAVVLIRKHLRNPHVGLYRREYLLKLREEFREKFVTRPRIVSGGLPSLGKRR